MTTFCSIALVKSSYSHTTHHYETSFSEYQSLDIEYVICHLHFGSTYVKN